MKVIVCDNYDEISEKAAEIFKEQINRKPDSVLGLATGSTPIGMYNRLVEMYNNKEIDFSRISSFNLDEYYPIEKNNEQSYHTFMHTNLFDRINIKPENVHIPNGETSDPINECRSYEDAILKSGGIDLQILGIGRNGHIGFNEPGAYLNTKTHITSLTDDTIDANSRFFDDLSKVPTHAITMGISTIMSSKKIILLASGHSKNQAVKELLSNNITTDNPSTMLKMHPDFTLICDKEAYSDIHMGVDIGGMSVKIGIVDNNNIIERKNITIDNSSSSSDIADNISDLCKELAKKYKIDHIGVGTPGIIKNGIVTASNLPFNNFNLKEVLSQKTGLPVIVENDASCAALGEQTAGAGSGSDNVILITLGTGIGCGIIINKKIYSGCGCAGEAGHMCIDIDGLACACGSKGCWEQYASVTALINQTKTAANGYPQSILANLCHDGITGKTVFEAAKQGCPTAQNVIDKYIDYLSIGINNLIKIFDPQIILISGGLSNEGDALLTPLKKRLAPFSSIKIAALKNDAGIIGAASL